MSTPKVQMIGLKGLSAYEVAVKNGFEGTETEWLESLKGEPAPETGGVSSWNDLTDKPFGEELTEALIGSETKTFGGGRSMGGALLYKLSNYSDGDTLYIEIDGVKYEGVLTIIVSAGPFGGTQTTYTIKPVGEHGVQASLSTGLGMESFSAPVEDGEHVVSLYGVTRDIKTLDPKFLPDTIPNKDDMISTPTTAAVGQTLVVKSIDDKGKPDEWETIDPVKSYNELSDTPIYENDTILLKEITKDFTSTSVIIGTAGIQNDPLKLTSTMLDECNVVCFDGAEYSVYKIDDIGNSGAVISTWGNRHLQDSSKTDNGLPFVISYNSKTKEYYICVRENDLGTHTLSAHKLDRKKLDPKYLPDTVLTEDDMPAIVSEVLSELPESEGSGAGPAIIDVIALPTEDIKEDVFYRVLTAKFLYGQFIKNDWRMYTVDALPQTGEMCWDGVTAAAYYSVSDNNVYGYVDTNVSAVMMVPVGWYTADILIPAIGRSYGGIITDITMANEDAVYVLLENVSHSYKDGVWSKMEVIGWRGTGEGSEIFNHLCNIASGSCSHAEGWETTATGNRSHAEGSHTTASGYDSHAEGSSSHAEGCSSHAEGSHTTASGEYSHAEGSSTTASGESSHAEGCHTTASGDYSHAEGSHTTASGEHSHAEGSYSHAEGSYSHAEGYNTTAAGRSQHVQGEFNIVDPEYDIDRPDERAKFAHIVGNGIGPFNPSNAHTLDWEGNAEYQGDVKANACGGENPISLVELYRTVENLRAEIEALKQLLT